MTAVGSQIFAQNVGIGETAPANKLAVKGSLSVGSGYSTTSAPADGAIIQGNVGIGTASPYGKFDEEGTNSAFHLYDFSPGTGTVLAGEFHGIGSNGALLRFTGGTGGYMDIGEDAAGDFIINQGSTGFTKFVLNQSNGYVGIGIGTATPTATLQVSGTTSTTNLQMTSGATSGYILKSDASGNASWVNPTSITTGTTVSNATSGNTISTTVNGVTGAAVTVSNIYTADGTLTGSRTVTAGANTLTFTSSTGNLNFTTTSGVNQTTGGNMAMGNSVSASGGTSVAFGTSNTSSGVASFSTGWQNNATGSLSTAFGQQNTASGYTGFVVNISNTASGGYTTASGKLNIAAGEVSSVTGQNNTAYSYGEHVIGINATTYTPTSTTAYSATDRIFNVGNGASIGARSDAMTILKNGNTGIGVSSPTNKLEVAGNTKTTNLQMTNGATANYIMQSDASGNASWVNPTSITTGTTNTLGLSGNTLTSTVNGVAATSSAVSAVSNASSTNTLTTTVNGITSAGAPIINSNALGLSGTTLTSTINGVASSGLNLSSLDNNIYNSDGTLTGTRTVTMGANNLIFTPSTGNIILGSGEAGGSPAGGTLRAPNAGSGNTAGGALTLNGGFGWGSGPGGSVIINGGSAGGSGGTNGNVYVRGGVGNSSQGAVYVNDLNSGTTFLNGAGGTVNIGRTTAGTAELNVLNGISVDNAATNNGTISSSNATTAGNSITFGASSGEGIASNRSNSTAGQNQYGVDLYTNFVRRLSVTNGGNVGIGTTNPATLTEISGATTDLLKLTSTSGGAGNHAYLDFVTYSGTYVNGRIGAVDMGSNNGSLVFETGNVGSASTVTTERMRILNSGYVGINTTTPSNTLNVGATTNLGNGIDIGLPNDQLGNNGSSYAIRFYGYRDVATYVISAKISAQRTYICCAGSGSTPWLEQGTDLVFSTTNAPAGNGSAGAPLDVSSERMRIKDNGYIGIGTSTPAYTLDVSGTTNTSGSTNYGRLNSSQSGTASGSYNINPTINASSDVRAGGGFYAFSDRRIKKDIEPISSLTALEKIKAIEPVNYGFIDSFYRPSFRTVGFIAQDVEKVIPEAVSKLSDYIPNILTEAEICMIDSQMILDFNTPKHLHSGDVVKVYKNNGSQTSVDVSEHINDALYVISGAGIGTEPVFVFGSKVNDFRSVDYDKVFTVGIGAIQELAKQLADEQNKNQTLQKQLSDMQLQNKDARTDIDKLKASVETLQQIIGARTQK